MKTKEAIKISLEMGNVISKMYLDDLTDEELMLRPHPECNHVNFQLGHLITSENQLLSQLPEFNMPELPPGMTEKYSKENAKSDEAGDFMTKDELMTAFETQRAATMAALESLSDDDLGKETGMHFAPTYASIISLQGSHWAMHSGQWVIIRRMAGKPIVM